jgi:hypothetical protein
VIKILKQRTPALSSNAVLVKPSPDDAIRAHLRLAHIERGPIPYVFRILEQGLDALFE